MIALFCRGLISLPAIDRELKHLIVFKMFVYRNINHIKRSSTSPQMVQPLKIRSKENKISRQNRLISNKTFNIVVVFQMPAQRNVLSKFNHQQTLGQEWLPYLSDLIPIDFSSIHGRNGRFFGEDNIKWFQ